MFVSSFFGKFTPARPILRCVVSWTLAHAFDHFENCLCRSVFRHHLLTLLEQLVGRGPISTDVSRVSLFPVRVKLLVVLLSQIGEIRILSDIADSGYSTALQTLPQHKLLTIKHPLLFLHDKFLESIRDFADLIKLNIDRMQLHGFV